MRHGSLFSGIGGFDLAASWMGWTNIFQYEKDPFCRKVLQYYWPKTVCYEDVRTFKGEEYKGRVDVLSGGFPCQPFSIAGRRRGTEDDRYLWPEMCRIVGEVQPRWVVGENVPGLLNWNGGMVFEQVQADLEAKGYEVWTVVLPACSVDAPHIRNRIWIIAHALGHQPERKRRPGTVGSKEEESESPKQEWQRVRDAPGNSGKETVTSEIRDRKAGNWERFPLESPLCIGDDGLSTRLDGIAFSRWRSESIKSGGNAIVPQVALQIFRVIEMMDN